MDLGVERIELGGFEVSGIDPEPRRGYRTPAGRDAALQAYSNAVWQRHEATHARGGPISTWPNRQTFKSNWPLLALDLIVADWKHAEAQAGIARSQPVLRTRWRYPHKAVEIIGELEVALLDPAPAQPPDWRSTYALELATQPELLFELAPDRPAGDGIELVLERAQLTDGERAVVRSHLYGDDVGRIAEDLKWKPQRVGTLLRNGLERLRWLGEADARKRGNVRGQRTNAGRTGNGHVSRSAPPRNGAHQESGTRGGSRAGRIRGVSAPTAEVLQQAKASSVDALGAL